MITHHFRKTLLLAAGVYSLHRRMRFRSMALLNASLHWHVCFAMMGLVLILLHTSDKVSAISGTAALYGLLALTMTGLLGRLLVRMLPRLIAGEVDKVLDTQGEDRLLMTSRQLQELLDHPSVNASGVWRHPVRILRLAAFHRLTPSWDLAYRFVKPMPQERKRGSLHAGRGFARQICSLIPLPRSLAFKNISGGSSRCMEHSSANECTAPCFVAGACVTSC